MLVLLIIKFINKYFKANDFKAYINLCNINILTKNIYRIKNNMIIKNFITYFIIKYKLNWNINDFIILLNNKILDINNKFGYYKLYDNSIIYIKYKNEFINLCIKSDLENIKFKSFIINVNKSSLIKTF